MTENEKIAMISEVGWYISLISMAVLTVLFIWY